MSDVLEENSKTEEPVNTTAMDTVEPADTLANESVNESADESVNESADESVNESANEPEDKPGDEPVVKKSRSNRRRKEKSAEKAQKIKTRPPSAHKHLQRKPLKKTAKKTTRKGIRAALRPRSKGRAVTPKPQKDEWMAGYLAGLAARREGCRKRSRR